MAAEVPDHAAVKFYLQNGGGQRPIENEEQGQGRQERTSLPEEDTEPLVGFGRSSYLLTRPHQHVQKAPQLHTRSRQRYGTAAVIMVGRLHQQDDLRVGEATQRRGHWYQK